MLHHRLVWVAVGDNGIEGVLVAFAAHGTFFPARLVGRPGAWVYGLVMKAFSDAYERGSRIWVTTIGSSEAEVKLAKLAQRRGGRYHQGYIGGQISSLLKMDVPKPEARRVAC